MKRGSDGGYLYGGKYIGTKGLYIQGKGYRERNKHTDLYKRRRVYTEGNMKEGGSTRDTLREGCT